MEENATQPDTEVAWAAGLYEAEGCATVSDKSPRLVVTSTDEDVIVRFADIMGGYVYGPYEHRRKDGRVNKPAWRWQIRGFDRSIEVFHAFAPFLGWRRMAQMHKALLGDELTEQDVRDLFDEPAVEGRPATAWAAGLIEGDGCIYVPETADATPRVSVEMTDQDVVRRVGRVLRVGDMYGPYARRRGHKTLWRWQVSGWSGCRRVVLAIYPWLCSRRRAKADNFLIEWLDVS